MIWHLLATLLLSVSLSAGLVEQEFSRAVSFEELNRGGITQEVLDQMALEYAADCSDFHILLTWPSIPYSEEGRILQFINGYGKCFYHKKFALNARGARKLIQMLHDKAPRIESVLKNYFIANVDWQPMMCFLIRMKNLERCIQLKKEARAHYGMGLRSLHIVDTFSESIDVATVLLTDRAIDSLCME